MAEKTVNGGCACGAVRFQLRTAEKQASLCHCAMCRRWCGGLPFASIDGEVTLAGGEDSLRWWKSSPWGERGFCGVCGSSLFWRAGGMEEWGVSLGALAGDAAASVAQHIFTDEAGGYYQFADDAPRFTGAQHIAAVLPELEKKFGEGFLSEALAQMRQHNGEKFAAEVEKLIPRAGE